MLILGAGGRRSGFPGVLAVVLLIVTLVTAPLPARIALSGRIGDELWQPTELSPGTAYSLAARSAVLDLTGLDPTDIDTDDDRLPVTVGAGELAIVIPDELTVEVVATVGVGEIAVDDPIEDRSTTGIGPADTVTIGDGAVDLVIDAQVSAGEITIERN